MEGVQTDHGDSAKVPATDPVSVVEGRPLFLIGPARSGTSLLYKSLCLNAEAAFISNWLRRFPGLPALAVLNRLPRRLPTLQRRVWFGGNSNAYAYGRARSWFERSFPAPVEGEPVFARCGIAETSGAQPSQAQGAALARTFATLLRHSGGRTVVCKRIANNRRIPFLARTFPNARFVAIIRDGRAVAYSLSRVDWWETSYVWWHGGTPTEWREEGGDPWELCARYWVEEVRAIEQGLAVIPPSSILRIAYERLVHEPIESLMRIATFGGLPLDPRWIRQLQQLRFPNMNEAWRSELDPDVVRRIERVQDDELTRYGYI